MRILEKGGFLVNDADISSASTLPVRYWMMWKKGRIRRLYGIDYKLIISVQSRFFLE